jgi:prepilin-type N-terminal cleavage/methylation domain-containing protein
VTHATTVARPGRTGFTLIELLVVVALLAVLAAIAVGTFFRVRNTQTAKAAEDSVAKY